LANAGHRQIVGGVIEYCDRVANWQTLFSRYDMEAVGLRAYINMADAILAAPTKSEHIQLLEGLAKPVVLMGHADGDFPGVLADDYAVGEMAAEYLVGQGVKSLAYCGLPHIPFSQNRSRGFADSAAKAGIKPLIYQRHVYPGMQKDSHEIKPFLAFLRSLPEPAGLMVVTSEIAAIVVHHCRLLDIKIPEHIMLLTVDDDEILCNITHPRMSAIDQASDRIGYEAAEMLDRMLKGQKPANMRVLIPPRKVSTRESTDLLHTDSPQIAQAIRFIRSHVEDGISVKDVLRAVPISRRALERAFLRNVGHTIHDEIIRCRIDRAKHLLHETDMPLPDISARCGFTYPSKLNTVFKRVAGMTPGQYRRHR